MELRFDQRWQAADNIQITMHRLYFVTVRCLDHTADKAAEHRSPSHTFSTLGAIVAPAHTPHASGKVHAVDRA